MKVEPKPTFGEICKLPLQKLRMRGLKGLKGLMGLRGLRWLTGLMWLLLMIWLEHLGNRLYGVMESDWMGWIPLRL